MKKHLIWKSEIDLEDYEDYFKEVEQEQGIELNDSQKWALADDDNVQNYYCEVANLNNANLPHDGQIIAIADIGLWNGRRVGYKLINQLSDILDCGSDDREVYTDGKNVRATSYGHDGTTDVIFRQLKPNRNLDNLCDKLYNSRNMAEANKYIRSYTTSIVKTVNAIYGW